MLFYATRPRNRTARAARRRRSTAQWAVLQCAGADGQKYQKGEQPYESRPRNRTARAARRRLSTLGEFFFSAAMDSSSVSSKSFKYELYYRENPWTKQGTSCEQNAKKPGTFRDGSGFCISGFSDGSHTAGYPPARRPRRRPRRRSAPPGPGSPRGHPWRADRHCVR